MTATGTGADWATHAQELVAALTESGDLHDPAWAAALAETPRHLLAPIAYQQQPDGTWVEIDTSGPGLELAYSPTTLVTEVDSDGRATSSSTKPDLMLRMLEDLDVHSGQRILEIGTGTGYNAAMLAHRLGDHLVFSVDIDAHLVARAAQRLADLGRHPTLATRDGIDGWPEHAPYDRIIATCSVPRIPWSWAQQLGPGGKLLADLKLGASAGNLVLLTRYDDRLEGRFTGRWAAFMGMRHRGDTNTSRAPKADISHHRTTTTPAQPWNTDREVWLVACLTLPAHLQHGYTLDPTTRTPTAATLSAPDGSWCEIDLSSAMDGSRRLREAGQTPLWTRIEDAYHRWQEWGRPGWERFGLTVTEHTHAIWLDQPCDIIDR